MKKGIRFLISFFIIFLGCNVFAFANEDVNKSFDETRVELEEDKSIKKFYDYVNELNIESELIEGMTVKEYVEEFLEIGQSPVAFESILKGIISFMFREVKTVFKLLLSFVVLALLTSLLNSLDNAFKNKAISDVAFFACYALGIMILTTSFLMSLNIAKDVIQSLVDFMAVLMPVLVFLLSTAGGITSALTIDPVVLILVSITPKIYINFIFPLILIKFVLEFINNLSNDFKLDKLSGLFKNIINWSQGIVLTIFVGTLAIRGISASTIDAVTLKTAKFAVDNFIPIVGKSFSDAITTVAGYSLVLKSAISSVGLMVVIAMILYPIVKLTMIVFACRLTSAVIQPVTDKRLVSSVSSVGDAVVMVLASVVSISVMFFIIIAIMSSAGRFIVGG